MAKDDKQRRHNSLSAAAIASFEAENIKLAFGMAGQLKAINCLSNSQSTSFPTPCHNTRQPIPLFPDTNFFSTTEDGRKAVPRREEQEDDTRGNGIKPTNLSEFPHTNKHPKQSYSKIIPSPRLNSNRPNAHPNHKRILFFEQLTLQDREGNTQIRYVQCSERDEHGRTES